MVASSPWHHTARGLAFALLALSASAFAQSPNFSSLPCPRRVTALLDFWANEKKKPGRTPCESARLDVTIQRDLNATALACPDDLTTVPSALAGYESTMNRLCTGKTNTTQPASTNNCPTTVINPAGVATSVLDPIKAEGSAQRALQTARDQLRYITDQGSCDSFANRQECESTKKTWRDMVAALECHANAERTGASNPASTQPSASVGSGKSQPPTRKGTAEDFLAFGDKSASSPSSSGGSAGAAQGSPAGRPGQSSGKGFLPFAEDSGGGESFPTPYCRFTQDASERHDQGRRGCAFDVIWVCEDRSSADPKRAWKKEATGSRGCGAIRSLDAIERDRLQLKRVSKELNRD